MSDLISREDAIEIIASHDETNGTEKVFTGREITDLLASLPSADRPQVNPNSAEEQIAETCDRPSNVLQEKKPTPIEDYMTGKSRLVDRPKGEWIMHIDDLFPGESTQECSNCHEYETIQIRNDNFCPNCGADMRPEK